jgi:hypothetical protein
MIHTRPPVGVRVQESLIQFGQPHHRGRAGSTFKRPWNPDERGRLRRPSLQNRYRYRENVPAAADAKQRYGPRVHRSSEARRESSVNIPVRRRAKTSGACQGYLGDHVIPLARGGADSASNMRWQRRQKEKLRTRSSAGVARAASPLADPRTGRAATDFPESIPRTQNTSPAAALATGRHSVSLPQAGSPTPAPRLWPVREWSL